MPFGVFEYSLGIVTGNPLGFDRPVFEALGIFSKQEDACAVGCDPEVTSWIDMNIMNEKIGESGKVTYMKKLICLVVKSNNPSSLAGLEDRNYPEVILRTPEDSADSPKG